MTQYIAIPIEVLVKYNEQGQIRPVKVVFADEMFVVDRVFTEKTVQPPWGGYSVYEYACLLKGKRKKLYFDKQNNKWFVAKEYNGYQNYVLGGVGDV